MVSLGLAEHSCATSGPIRDEILNNPPRPCTLRTVCVASVSSAHEPEIVDDTKSDRRNISFPTMSRRITGRLVASARLQHRYRASPAYHFRFSALGSRGVFQGRHPSLPISRARARGRWKFFGTLR